MNKIIIPNVNNNETEAELISWNVNDGDLVKRGDIIASLQTTKADVDIESDFEGYIKIISEINNSYEVGTTIAYVLEEIEKYENFDSSAGSNNIELKKSYTITKPAEIFIEKNNISKSEIEKLGISLVKVKDLEKLIKKSDPNLIEFDSIQKTIASNVKISHDQIPEAFILKKINVNETLIKIKSTIGNEGFTFDFAELIVFCLGKVFEKFPKFFSKIENNDFYKVSSSANIGLTLDVGKGLFVPVISNSNNMTLKSISTKIMEFKMKALRNNFKSDDFANCNFTVSLNTEADTIFVKPIIFPGQVCILSLNSLQKEVVIDDGKVQENTILMLGLAYDHRIINGSEANSFLLEIKSLIEGNFSN